MVSELRKELGTSQAFTLSFGSIVGVGWVVVAGSWIQGAGPIGAIAAFAVGGIVMILVGVCYAELGKYFPVSGGEVAYAYELYGTKTCFIIGWFLALGYIGTAVFEAVSVVWITATLFPGIEGRVLYTSFGHEVTLGTLVLGIGGMALITVLNHRGAKPAAKLQDLATYSKILLAMLFISAGILLGHSGNLRPLVQRVNGRVAWNGILALFLTTPFWLSGFNSVAQVLGEMAPSASRKTSKMVLLAIMVATAFYVLLIIACSMAMPWPQMVKLDLPAARAFDIGLHSAVLFRVVLIVALLGNITVWNATIMCGSRVLYSLGKTQLIPERFGAVTTGGAPGFAVIFIGILSALGILLGRAALLPVVNIASTCMAMAYVLVCAGVLQLHRRSWSRSRWLLITASLAVPVAVIIVLLSLYEPYVSAHRHFPAEWALFFAWTVLGAIFWSTGFRIRSRLSDEQRRALLLFPETLRE